MISELLDQLGRPNNIKRVRNRFLWSCFGSDAVYYEFGDYEFSVIYDYENERVYQISIYDMIATKIMNEENDLYVITWNDPDFHRAYMRETETRLKDGSLVRRNENEQFEEDVQKVIDKVKEMLDG